MNLQKASFFILLILLTKIVFGQGLPLLEITISEEKVNLTPGEREDAAEIIYQPGDTLRYLLRASNVGDGLMTSPSVTDPIPNGVIYIPHSALGEDSDISFSIDAGMTYSAWPPVYSVTDTQGRKVIKKATPEMVTHIRWNISKSLEPGQSTDMEFKVVVIP